MPTFKVEIVRTQHREVEIEADSYEDACDKALDMDRHRAEKFWSFSPLNDDLQYRLVSDSKDAT